MNKMSLHKIISIIFSNK